MERLTEEIQIGPWASLKNKAEAKPGAFANYDCLMAHMEAVTRLKYYEDLEEQGRLVVLPCKVGDTVYQIRNKRHARGTGVSPRIVSSVCVWSGGEYAMTHQGMTYCKSRDLGKTWFLTREEAEAALRG